MTAGVELGEDEELLAIRSRRVVTFVNIAHFLDHFLLLIYPTAVIALVAEGTGDYGTLISLSTGSFVAFGLLSLPAGYFANRIGRRNMLAIFLIGGAIASLGVASANSPQAIFLWLLLLGGIAAIYHPIGASLLIDHCEKDRLGRALGVNGVWGNLGTAAAPIITGFLASSFGWRAAFIIPAVAALTVGLFYLALTVSEEKAHAKASPKRAAGRPSRFAILTAAFVVTAASSGMTFTMLTVTLPKAVDERLGLPLPLWLVGSLSTIVLIFGAFSQLNMGRLIEKVPLPRLLALLSMLQPLGFAIAWALTGIPMLFGLLFTVIAIYGNVVVIDAMVARYVPAGLRPKLYGLRYFLSFGVAGAALPLAGYLHDTGGFEFVFAAAFGFGLALFGATLVLWRYMKQPAAA